MNEANSKKLMDMVASTPTTATAKALCEVADMFRNLASTVDRTLASALADDGRPTAMSREEMEVGASMLILLLLAHQMRHVDVAMADVIKKLEADRTAYVKPSNKA